MGLYSAPYILHFIHHYSRGMSFIAHPIYYTLYPTILGHELYSAPYILHFIHHCSRGMSFIAHPIYYTNFIPATVGVYTTL